MWAQGGPTVARKALAVRIAARQVTIKGRYATYEDDKPVGVFATAFPNEVYEGVHYRWTIDGAGSTGPACFAAPRTGVNNCTRPDGEPAWTRPENAPGRYAAARNAARRMREGPVENRGFGSPGSQRWSATEDRDRQREFQKHSPRHAGDHLSTLQRKYRE
jgi:hypothetical protein